MVRTVNICMAIRTLSETDDSGNIPRRCVAAGSDGASVNECKYPETKLCKREGSMWASCLLQESTWVNALLRDGEWNAPTSGFQLYSCHLLRIYLIESVSVKQMPLILGNASVRLCLGRCLSKFATTYKPAVVGVYTYHAHQWTLAGSTSHELYSVYKRGCNKGTSYIMVANNMKAIYQHSIYNYKVAAELLNICRL